MVDTILVLNAGSSSLKFSLFLVEDKTLPLTLGGQLQGLYTAPKFQTRDATGAVIGEHRWEGGRPKTQPDEAAAQEAGQTELPW